MAKYTYKPIPAKVDEVYKENTGNHFFPDEIPDDMPIRVIVEVKDEDESYHVRVGLTDVRMWELESKED